MGYREIASTHSAWWTASEAMPLAPSRGIDESLALRPDGCASRGDLRAWLADVATLAMGCGAGRGGRLACSARRARWGTGPGSSSILPQRAI